MPENTRRAVVAAAVGAAVLLAVTSFARGSVALGLGWLFAGAVVAALGVRRSTGLPARRWQFLRAVGAFTLVWLLALTALLLKAVHVVTLPGRTAFGVVLVLAAAPITVARIVQLDRRA